MTFCQNNLPGNVDAKDFSDDHEEQTAAFFIAIELQWRKVKKFSKSNPDVERVEINESMAGGPNSLLIFTMLILLFQN